MHTPYHLKLEIPMLPQSLNIVLRRHFFKSNKQNQMWDTLIFGLVRGKLPQAPLQKAKLKFIRHSHRSLDFDGLVGSLKPVCDSLVTCGVLADDSWKVLQAWEVDQVFRKKKDGPLLVVEVSELSSIPCD